MNAFQGGWTIFMQNLIDAFSSVGSCLFTTYAVFPSILYTSNRAAG
jgi:hypothetical protein